MIWTINPLTLWTPLYSPLSIPMLYTHRLCIIIRAFLTVNIYEISPYPSWIQLFTDGSDRSHLHRSTITVDEYPHLNRMLAYTNDIYNPGFHFHCNVLYAYSHLQYLRPRCSSTKIDGSHPFYQSKNYYHINQKNKGLIILCIQISFKPWPNIIWNQFTHLILLQY